MSYNQKNYINSNKNNYKINYVQKEKRKMPIWLKIILFPLLLMWFIVRLILLTLCIFIPLSNAINWLLIVFMTCIDGINWVLKKLYDLVKFKKKQK